MPIFGLHFFILHCVRNSESSPDTHVHVHIPPEQGGQVEIEKRPFVVMAEQRFVENAAQSLSAKSL